MEGEMNETATRIRQMVTVALAVADQDRALDFYVGKLGFEKRRDMHLGPAGRWVEVGPPGAATTIALVPPSSGAPVAAGETGIRLLTDDAEADHAGLLARGADADPELMRMDPAPPMFTVRDPDGNRLVIVEGR
jgi:catechol 2,3-dioxygenase-like lactoylglutathione lyase family enzyme